MQAWGDFLVELPGASQVTGLDMDATDLQRSSPGSSPGPPAAVPPVSLSRRGTTEGRTVQGMEVSVREAVATFSCLLCLISEHCNVRDREAQFKIHHDTGLIQR